MEDCQNPTKEERRNEGEKREYTKRGWKGEEKEDKQGEGIFDPAGPGKMMQYISFHLSSSDNPALALACSFLSCSSVITSGTLSFRSRQGVSAL